MNNLFIILVTYNNQKTIKNVVESIGKKYYKNILIVDNNSTDSTLLIVSKYRSLTIIKNKINLGYGAGNNVGIKAALKKGAKFLLILNPDVILYKNFFKNIYKYISGKYKFSIVGPKIYKEDGSIWSMGGVLDKKRYTADLLYYGKKDNKDINSLIFKEIDFVSGTAMLVKTEVFLKIGFFKEDYFLYYEDVDFCVRAIQAGLSLIVDPLLKIIHFESSSVGKNSQMMQYYLARNHLLFVERLAPKYSLFREFIRFPKTFWQHYKRDEKFANLGIRDYLLRRFNKNDYWS